MQLKLTIIEDFFSQAENADINQKMGKVFGMKKKGYVGKHKHNYLPVAQDDFYCIHAILTDVENDNVVMAFKVSTFSSSNRYNVPFLLDEYLKEGNDIDRFKFKKYLKNHIKNGNDFSYSGGWTVNPDYKGRGLSTYLKEVYTGIHYLIHRHFNLKAITGIGVLNFNTSEFFKEWWGLKEMSGSVYNFSSCPYLDCVFIYNDLDHVSEVKKSLASKYIDLWNAREEYIGQKIILENVA